ncbi:DsrE family protein [Pedobacter sp. MC2016-24]|uniref:DsrE family protein n=1 Tax=Pedobacter sp. MC2016-24 TaxID=2780090 RepID=UPI00187FE9C2|nr:DsrE family protein [Pedobacter sp. MC2016-24]MBE9601505.1 DsrE family protein [Pedobacter sp. MC2016-24]
MKHYKLLLIAFALMALTKPVVGQTNSLSGFAGAKATKRHYKALYVLNSSEEKKISGTLRNIKNALDDPRLKGKLEIELIAFGEGVAVYYKTGKYEESLKALVAKGVILAQCENTIRERKIQKSELFDFIHYVPSGNGEIIIRSAQGWAIVHP